MKIWVLYGYNQHTSQKTLYSADRLFYEAKKRDLDLEIVTPEKIFEYFQKNQKPDCIFPRMGAYTPLATLHILEEYEKMGVCIFNSPKNIRDFSDKKTTSEILVSSNILIPRTYSGEEFLKNTNLLEYPYICKKRFGMGGKNVFLIKNAHDFHNLLTSIGPGEIENFIFQECIVESLGSDVRVCMLGDQNVGTYKRIAQKDEFRANFSLGADLYPYEYNKTLQEISVKIMKEYKLDFIGIDFLYDGAYYRVGEINTAPGFLGCESVIGENIVGKVLDALVKKAQKK